MSVEIIIKNLVMAFEYVSFFCVIMRRDIKRKHPRQILFSTVVFIVWLGSMIGGFDWNSSLLGPVPCCLIPYIIYLWLIFDISFIESMVFGVTNWLILSMIEVNLIIALQKPGTKSSYLEICIMLVITCFLWLFYFFTKDKYIAHMIRLPIKVWILLDLIMFLIMMMQAFFTYVIVENLLNNMSIFGRNLLLLSGIAIILLLFIVLYYCCSAYSYHFQKDLVEAQILQQKEYFVQLLQKEEETKKFRHDIINDFLQLQSFCSNHECQQLQNYLEKMIGSVKAISEKNFDVGNNIVNTILNYYLVPIRDKHKIIIHGYISEDISIDDRELCVICANLVKNAMEAVVKTDAGKIEIQFDEGKDYLFIQVINSFVGDIQFDTGGLPKTSKKDSESHGIGMGNIKKIVKKNSGLFKIETHNDLFKAEVFIKKYRSRINKSACRDRYCKN